MLSASALTQAGPIMLETAIKHYFNKKSVTKDSKAREEFLFDEAFVLVKSFLEISTRHTVDELQKFSLTKTPSPPWVLLHRVLIPLQPSCSRAAEVLIEALGGEQQALRIAGGTKWWTVRSQAGVEAEWIGIKKDFKREEQRYKRAQQERSATLSGKEKDGRKSTASSKGERKHAETEKGKGKEKEKEGEHEASAEGSSTEGGFTEEMDHLRCMLYIHGGAYYWGSINTHRYTIWRYARKMRGRCFAVNYRKAPQFPWPCALQDCIAAYLYLIRPPPGAKHRPIDPRNLIIAGDSAGGGLSLALLQVIRDTGLPMPAGAVLISPWCDLTHSFPSILQNTATDIIPPYGFIHKPSTLWPPPAPALTEEVQNTLRQKVSDAVHRLAARRHDHKSHPPTPKETAEAAEAEPSDALTASAQTRQAGPPGEETTARGDTAIGDSSAHPNESTLDPVAEKGVHHHPGPTSDKSAPSFADPALAQYHALRLLVNGQEVVIRSQIQLYATNEQLAHPLVSPALGYLGGLPPLLVIASDKEVLRDEIIYSAHKAARPSEYPIKQSTKELSPLLRGIEGRYGPTQVHLQVYDNTCHVLPLFSMTEPAKHCYRAIANFCRFATAGHRGSNLPKDSETPPRQQSEPAPTDLAPLGEIARPVHSASVPGTLDTSVPSAAEESRAGSIVIESPVRTSFNSPSLGPSIGGPVPATALHESPPASPLLAPSRPDVLQSQHRQSSFKDTLRSVFLSPANQARRRSYKSPDYTDDETGSNASPLSSPPPETENTSFSYHSTPTASSQVDLDMPVDEVKLPKDIPPGFAGNWQIYSKDNGRDPFSDNMIRERVGGRGQCRDLEAPADLPACNQPLEQIGVVKEGPAMRYLNGQQLWDDKYASTAKRIAKRRQEHLRLAESDAGKTAERWKDFIKRKKESHAEDDFDEQNYLFQGEFSWTWALKGERPPPTAIIARRDTSEARALARQADRMVDPSMQLGGLALWSAMTTFFSKESGSSVNADPAGANPRETKDTLGKMFKRKTDSGA